MVSFLAYHVIVLSNECCPQNDYNYLWRKKLVIRAVYTFYLGISPEFWNLLHLGIHKGITSLTLTRKMINPVKIDRLLLQSIKYLSFLYRKPRRKAGQPEDLAHLVGVTDTRFDEPKKWTTWGSSRRRSLTVSTPNTQKTTAAPAGKRENFHKIPFWLSSLHLFSPSKKPYFW